MPENLHLVTELAIILIAAGVFTLISKALKQPLILGYIVAGFLVGPKLGIIPQFGSESISEWSEIGIVFLLFGLGLEFSFKNLLKIGSSALITAGVSCIGMFIVGTLTARVMGWGTMEGVFLGGMISMSSTTIIIKAYDEMKLKQKPYASLIFGALVFEDLIAILLMVLLSTLAVTGKFEGTQMLMGIFKLIFFLTLWFLVGIYVIPSVFRKTRKHLNDEIMLLVSIGLCFLMVVLANIAGFSSALGAFVMGSILAETVEVHRIERLTGRIKDLFGAIFFVSVGMMVDPAVIINHWQPILIITLVTIFGKMLCSTTGAILAGQGLNNAVHAGFTLAQLGEFSFIIAGLGCSFGVLRDFIYPVIIAVSVITTFTTPYMIKLGDPAAAFLQRILPKKILDRINPPENAVSASSKEEGNEWKKLLKGYALRMLLYGVISLAIVIGSNLYMFGLLKIVLPNMSDIFIHVIVTLATITVLIPFVMGLVTSSKSMDRSSELLLKQNESNKWPILSLILLKTLIATVLIANVIDHNFSMSWWTSLFLIVVLGAFILLSRNSVHSFRSLEQRFMKNYNAKENMERMKAPVTSKVNEHLAEYNVGITPVTISSDFNFIGKTLREMPFGKNSGINILKIQRGSHSILVPSGDEVIYPGDRLLAVGNPEQLENFVNAIRENTSVDDNAGHEEFTVSAITLTAVSPLTGRSLRDSNMRSSGCSVVNVLHDGKMLSNPSAEFVFSEGDTVWIAGEENSVSWYRNTNSDKE